MNCITKESMMKLTQNLTMCSCLKRGLLQVLLIKNDVTSQPNGFIMGTVTFSEKKKKQEIEENKDP